MTTVNEIERRAVLDFLTNLPDWEVRELESQHSKILYHNDSK